MVPLSSKTTLQLLLMLEEKEVLHPPHLWAGHHRLHHHTHAAAVLKQVDHSHLITLSETDGVGLTRQPQAVLLNLLDGAFGILAVVLLKQKCVKDSIGLIDGMGIRLHITAMSLGSGGSYILSIDHSAVEVEPHIDEPVFMVSHPLLEQNGKLHGGHTVEVVTLKEGSVPSGCKNLFQRQRGSLMQLILSRLA